MLTGNFANAGIMLIAVAIAARGLGPEIFGSMVLVLALASTIERLIRFETWQPLIKFAADEELVASPLRMARLYSLGLMLDLITASVAALTTILAALLFKHVFGWHSIPPEAVAIYAIAMICNITGAPGAALRLAGQFRTIAYVQIPANVVRALLAGLCYWQGAGLLVYVAAWTFAEVSYRLATLWLGLRALTASGIPNPASVRVAGLLKDFPGFMSFAWSINLSTMLRTLTTDADELVVGAMAGQSAASMYNIAKRIVKFGQEIGNQIQTVIYPELARMWSCREDVVFRATIVKTQIVLCGFALLIIAAAWTFGSWLIRLGPGVPYLPTYPLLEIQVMAVLFTMHAAPGRSALLSIGRHRTILGIAAIGTTVFYAVMIPAVMLYGAGGASFAHVILAFTTAALIDLEWRRQIKVNAVPSTPTTGVETN